MEKDKIFDWAVKGAIIVVALGFYFWINSGRESPCPPEDYDCYEYYEASQYPLGIN